MLEELGKGIAGFFGVAFAMLMMFVVPLFFWCSVRWFFIVIFGEWHLHKFWDLHGYESLTQEEWDAQNKKS